MRDDAAQIQAIEAILVAVALVGAATMVVMYSQPATSPDATRNTVGESVEDSLDTLLDEQMSLAGYGDSQLSRAIALCLMDDCERLREAIAGSLPEDAMFNAYLSNGFGEIPLINNQTPAGEAVAVTRLVEPKWSYTFLGFDYNYSDPTLAQPLNVYALPVLKSNALTEGGTPVGFTVTGFRKDTGEEVRFTAFGSTLQQKDAHATTTPAVSVHFVNDGAPTAFLDRTGAASYIGEVKEPVRTLDGTEAVTPDLHATSLGETVHDRVPADASDATTTTNDTAVATDTAEPVTNSTEPVTTATTPALPGHKIVVRVVNSGDEAVDAGTPLRVEVPRDWSATAPIGDNAEWVVRANATDRNGTYDRSHVLATLWDDLPPGGVVNLTLQAEYHGASEDYRMITAEFGKNGRARAEALLRGADHLVPPATDQPYLAVNVPKPVGSNASTTWTLGFVAPLVTQDADEVSDVNPDGLLDVGVRVTGIDVWGWNTHGLFSNVTDVQGLGGNPDEWSVTDGNFSWRGTLDVHRDSPLNVRFNATAAELLNAPIARHVGTMPVEFGTWRAKLVQQFEYGFLRGSVYPEDAGASERPGHASSTGTHTAVGMPQWQSQALRGAGNYHVRELPTYRDAAAGGWIQPDARDVRIGETVTLEADVGSLLRNLQDAGSSSVNVTLRVYGPFTVEKKVPIWERSLTTSGDGEAVTDLVTWDVNADRYPDVIVGTSLGRVYAIDGSSGTVDESRVWDADPTLVDPPAIVRLVRGTWDGAPTLYVGTAAEGTAPRVHALDANLATRAVLPAAVTNGTLLALHPGTDFDGDGTASVLATFSGGSTHRISPTPGADGALTSVVLHAQGAAGAAKLAALEHLGAGGPAGAVIATDAAEGKGTVGAVALTDTKVEHADGREVVLEALLSPHNLAAVDGEGTTRWDLPLMPVTAMDDVDVDEDGGTDVAAGLRTGHVVAIDGEHGNALMSPLRFQGNLRVIDSVAVGPDEVWFLTEEGGVGRTRDGWNTLGCVCDPVTGQIITLPGAVSITRDSSGRVYVAHEDLVSVLEPTPSGVIKQTFGIGDQSGFTNSFVSTSPNDTAVHRVQAVEAAGDKLLAIVDLSCENDPTTACASALVWSQDQGVTWGAVTSGAQSTLAEKGLHEEQITCGHLGNQHCLRIYESTVVLVDPTIGESRAAFDLQDKEVEGQITAARCHTVDATDACHIGTDSGKLYLVEDPWSPEESRVKRADGINATVKAIEPAGDVIYAAGDNAVYASWDGGASYRKLHLPVGAHVPSAIHGFPNGQAYVMGGTSDEMQVLVARSHQRMTQVSGVIPLDADGGLVKNVSLAATDRFLANTTKVDGAWIDYYVKDASGTWIPFERESVRGSGLPLDAPIGGSEAATLDAFTAAYAVHAPIRFEQAQDLDALEWRAVLHASPDVPAAAPRIFNLTFAMDVVAPDTGHALASPRAFENFTDPAYLSTAATTADVNTSSGVVTAPLANLHWSQDVGGEVLDVLAADVTGDGVPEIIAGTGSVLTVTDPDSWSSDVDAVYREVGTDNRVYVLDPSTAGGIRWQSPSLGGKVTHVELTEDTLGNGVLLATAVAERNATTRVYAFDADTGAELWTHALNKPASALTHLPPKGQDAAVDDFPVVGTAGAGGNDDGTVFALEGGKGDRKWRTAYGEVGHYRVPVTLGDAALFGPHVTEIEVSWVENLTSSATGVLEETANENETTELVEDTASDGTSNLTSTADEGTRQIVQAARYFNYFTAVPPDGRMPVSPVYALKIEAWLGDWDYTTWTPTALDREGEDHEGPGTECTENPCEEAETSSDTKFYLGSSCHPKQGSFCGEKIRSSNLEYST